MEKKKTNQKSTVRRRAPAEQHKQKAPHAQPRKNPPVQEQPVRVTPEVVYLAPKPFSRNRFILHLATVVAVVLALTLGLAIFFKVEKVEVSGCGQYTAWQVQQASGIQMGEQLLTFSRARASSKILSALPYVKTVRIGVSLPDTVKIEIVETRVTYALEDQEGKLWLMDSDGKLVEQATPGSSYTLVSGVTIDRPVAGEQAVAYESGSTQTDPEGIPVPVTITGSQRLNAVRSIAAELEKNGVIGEVASIDMIDYYGIVLWYGEKYQVLLGDTNELSRKIQYLKAFVDDYNVNRPYESGVLDLSDPEWIEYSSFTEPTE